MVNEVFTFVNFWLVRPPGQGRAKRRNPVATARDARGSVKEVVSVRALFAC